MPLKATSRARRTVGSIVFGFAIGGAGLSSPASADAACPCFDAAAIVQTCRDLPIRSFTQWTRSNDRFALSCGPSKDWPVLAEYSVLWNISKDPGVYVQELSHNREKCSGPSTGGPSGDRSTSYREHESCLAALRAAAKSLAIPLGAR